MQPLLVATRIIHVRVPPQNEWIFKGPCEEIALSQSGNTPFNLAEYGGVTVKGTFGIPTNGYTPTFYIIDAFGHGSGDIKPWDGTDFPNFHTPLISGKIGTGVIYIEVMNTSPHNIYFHDYSSPSLAPWKFTITDTNGFPGTSCTLAAYLYDPKVSGDYAWEWTRAQIETPSDNKVTIHQYLQWDDGDFAPNAPTYFQVFCNDGST